jgi:hypothetical protein
MAKYRDLTNISPGEDEYSSEEDFTEIKNGNKEEDEE